MNESVILYAPWLACVVIGAIYGFAIGHRKVFPFEFLRSIAIKLQLADPSKIRVQEPRLSHFRVISSQSEFVMLGESNTAAGLWNELLPGKEVANRGVNNDTFVDMKERLDTVTNLNPRAVLVTGGVNDFLQGLSVDTVVRNSSELINSILGSGFKVVLQSGLECNAAGRTEVLKNIREYNLRIKVWAEKNKVPFVDINKGLTTANDGLEDKYTFDGIHLLGPAYSQWAANLKEYFDSQDYY